LVQDAIYPTAFVDGGGKPLTGRTRYVIHFDKGQTPPAKAFWSITMYDADSFLVENPINRYNFAAWMPLTHNEDGSLELYLQKDSPGKDKEANWLPSPEGGFSVTLRIYRPKKAVLDGKWQPPAVRVAQQTTPARIFSMFDPLHSPRRCGVRWACTPDHRSPGRAIDEIRWRHHGCGGRALRTDAHRKRTK
jgi:hypothetical protein